MNKKLSILLAIFISLSDQVGSILFFILLGKNQKKEIFSYGFGTSTFDLVLLSTLRLCVVLGGCFGLLRNGNGATKHIKKTSKVVVYLGLAISIYGVLKVVYFSEDDEDEMNLRFWLLIGLTFFSSILVYISWIILSLSKPSTFKRTLLINDDGTENDTSSTSSTESDGSNEDDNEEEDEDGNKDNQINKLDKEAAKKFSTSYTVIKLIKYAKSDAIYLLFAVVFLTVNAIAQSFLPYYTGKVVGYIVIEKDVDKFQTAMLYVGVITLVAGLAAGMRAGLFTLFQARYRLRLQHLLFERIMHQDIGFFDVRNTGEITSRLTSDCTKIGDTLGLNINVFLRSNIKIIGVLFFMIRISWKLSIVTLVSIPIIAIISEAFSGRFREIGELIQTKLAFANESAQEAISSIRTVRSFAAESNEVERYYKRLLGFYGMSKKEAIVGCGYRWCIEVTDLAMSLLILFYGGHMVIQNDLSGGSLISFILYSFELGYAIEEIGDVYTGLMEAVGASKNVLVYIERKPAVDNSGTVEPSDGIEGEVSFNNVSFSYPSRLDVPVLQNVTFSAKKGEIVALVGPSGGGKTSIVSLLEHFYEPLTGDILIDGVNLREYNHKFIHEKISMVQQEPVLFARTVSENIAYGLRSEVSDDDIKKNAGLANADTFIEEMPKSYNTQTGEKGIQLSGGQKQRVAIARALIRNPSVLILDEATSALDSESEYLVQQAINKNLGGRTVIVIAHRLSTIEKADKILVIDKGRIVEIGKHVDLINQDGVYAGLVKRQMLGVEGMENENSSASNEGLDIHPGNVQRSISQISHASGSSPSSFTRSHMKI